MLRGTQPRCWSAPVCLPAAVQMAKGLAKRRRMNTAAGSSAVGTGAQQVADSSAANNKASEGKGQGQFRFWIEERRFKGPGSKCVVQQALFENGGVRTGGYPKAAPCAGPLGYTRSSDWDLLWSPARLALKAAAGGVVRAGQLISAYPGLMSLTRKRRLPATLYAAYGEGAWELMPQSFQIPDELRTFQAHAATRPASELWILKTAQHLGKGLKLLTAAEAAAEAAKKPKPAPKGSPPAKPYVLAQRYCADPLLIQGRKFGIRVWVLVTGHDPLRAYLHTNGLVLFSTHEYSNDSWATETGGVALGHVTNYAQNMDGMVWDMEQLKDHMGAEAFDQLWGRISRNAAMVVAAALKDMAADMQLLALPPESCFELLGLDYLVDSSLVPWLLEVNGTPSLAVDHEEPRVEALIGEQKGGMTSDMFKLLGVSSRFAPRYEAMRLATRKVKASAGTAGAAAGAAGAGLKGRKRRAAAEADEEGEQEAGEDSEVEEAGAAQATAGTGGDQAMAEAEAQAGDERGAQKQRGQRAQRLQLGAAAGGQAGPSAGGPIIPAELKERLAPTSNAAVLARVESELRNRGRFQPLMPLFPMAVAGAGAGGSMPAGTSAAAGSPGSRQPLAEVQLQGAGQAVAAAAGPQQGAAGGKQNTPVRASPAAATAAMGRAGASLRLGRAKVKQAAKEGASPASPAAAPSSSQSPSQKDKPESAEKRLEAAAEKASIPWGARDKVARGLWARYMS